MCDFQKLINEVYKEVKGNNKGKKAHYIPELAKANEKKFGISICDVNGKMYHVGDYKYKVAIESISKLFTLAAAVKKHGTKKVFNKIGMEGSSLPFNSLIAAKLTPDHTINPFVNQGAISTTSLLFNKNEKSNKRVKKELINNMSDFASINLSLGKNIFESESETNNINMSLAYLLYNNNRLYAPVKETVDAYTYQCSVKVTSDDLARMASVFANKGVNPVSNERLLTKKQTIYILNNVLPEGLYEYSDSWISKTDGGAYAKSGVGGGLLIVIPGVCGIGIISPRLDENGNSVKGIDAGERISKKISGNPFNTSKCIHNKTCKNKKKNNKTRKNK